MWKFLAFSVLRFYVKSILCFVEFPNIVIWHFLRLWSKNLIIVCNFRGLNFAKHVMYALGKSETSKMTVFELLESSKLISRKIWLSKKCWNFHTELWMQKKVNWQMKIFPNSSLYDFLINLVNNWVARWKLQILTFYVKLKYVAYTKRVMHFVKIVEIYFYSFFTKIPWNQSFHYRSH